MALLKNKGPMLTSEYYGSVDLIPPEYRAKIGLKKFEQEVPVDILPDLLIDPLVQSQVVQTRTDERLKTNFEFIGDLDTELTDEVFIKETCQVGHRTRKLVPEGTDLITGCLTESAEQKNLGNGLLDQIQVQVDELFGNTVSEVSLIDALPDIFKAVLPSFEHAETECGTIDDPPTLGIGEFRHREEQISGCRKRITTSGRAGITYPQSITLLKHTGPREFGGAITRIDGFLDDSEPIVEAGVEIVSSEVRNLGNATWFRQTERLDPDLFSEWPILESRLWDENMRLEYTETRQVVASGTPEDPDPGGVFGWVSEVRAIDDQHSIKVNTSKPTPSQYYDFDHALISYESKPFRFPGLLYWQFGYYVRHADAALCKHRIRTWWVKAFVTPVVVEDEIIMDDVVINNLSNTGLTYSGPVLHDDLQIGSVTYPATTPSGTQYSLGTPSGGTILHNVASLFSPGTTGGYSIGDTLNINLGSFHMNVDVTCVYDVGTIIGLICGTTIDDTSGTFPPGTYGPIAASSTGGGAGALFNVWSVELPAYTPGTQWIGTWRVIASSVKPEKEKDVWRVQTEEVVMR